MCLWCRYLYFLQLKHLILNGDLQCSHDIAVKLASYALQGTRVHLYMYIHILIGTLYCRLLSD